MLETILGNIITTTAFITSLIVHNFIFWGLPGILISAIAIFITKKVEKKRG